jgi:myo-inositol-1(or 4)-monophosphatase
LNELYSAADGQGAFLNQTTKLPLFDTKAIAPLKDLSECLVMTEMGADRSAAVISRKIDAIHNLVASKEDPGVRSVIQNAVGTQVHSIRSTGSAALNLCCVAKGVADIFWEIGCWEWDVCAAVVILREAGGIVLDGTIPGDQEVNIFCRRYLGIRPTGDRESQMNIARQFWSVVPKDIDAPRDAVPGGYEP